MYRDNCRGQHERGNTAFINIDRQTMTSIDTPKRLVSLDVFRGVTIATMVLVNDPGNWDTTYAQLKHAAWNGWTITDMVFPFFLWIVGVAMTLSFARRMESGADKGKLMLHVVRRAAIIFLLGIVVNGFPFGLAFGHEFSFSTLRIPGVLQRIAVCYLIASAIFLTTSVRGQVIWAGAFLLVYWLALMLIPVPGYGAGHLEPQGNLGWFIDSTLFNGHTWVWAPAPGFDPEGILSTLPAIATTLFGILTGHWLRTNRPAAEKIAWMFTAGIGMVALGWFLSIWLPINKNLWTTPYSIFMGGWALVGLATCHWLIDVNGYRRWATPFVIFGMNAIAIYVVSELLATLLGVIQVTGPEGTPIGLQEQIYKSWFAPLADPYNASLLYSISYVLLMFLIAWVMWKRRWFLKI
jgi:predicted acyltransferase